MTIMQLFTNLEKAQAAEREVKYRKRVYNSLIQRGKMTVTNASYEIAVMNAIAQDYRERHQKEDALI